MADIHKLILIWALAILAIDSRAVSGQSNSRTVAGSVVDAYGRPIEGAYVQVLEPRVNRVSAETRSAADGRFEMPVRGDGSVVVKAALPGFRQSQMRVEPGTARASIAVLMLVLDDLEGVAPSPMVGEVRDSNGKPVPRAIVTLSGLAGADVTPLTTVSDDSGTFAASGSRNVPYLVSAFIDGQYGVAVSPIPDRSDRVPVTVTLMPLGR